MLKLSRGQKYSGGSRLYDVVPGTKYQVSASIRCDKCSGPSAYLIVIVLGNNSEEVKRYIKWIKETDKRAVDHDIIFTAPENSAKAVVGYRINREVPMTSDIVIDLQDINTVEVAAASPSKPDLFDDRNDFFLPPINDLSSRQMADYEKKLVWIFGCRRSGTTWLATDLLRHPSNLKWIEPDIGKHLTLVDIARQRETYYHNAIKIKDKRPDFITRPDYLFSKQMENCWRANLRKFLISSAYSWSRDTTKNLIIKEMYGEGADVIMKCLPNSKMIFLLRDGRDSVESLLDAHSPKGWAPVKLPNNTPEQRIKLIQFASSRWVIGNRITHAAYLTHSPANRLLVKYESLRDDTPPELRKIYDLIGIRISDNELKETAEDFSFKNIPSSRKGPGKVYRAATTGGWRNTFSKEEIDMMNDIMGKALVEYGYQA